MGRFIIGSCLMFVCVIMLVCLMTLLMSSCTPVLLEAKTRVGPEFIKKEDKPLEVRYYIQPGLQLKFKTGISVGVHYRHRNIDFTDKQKENAVFIDASVPIWREKK